MKNRLLAIAMLLTIGMSSQTFAACDAPDDPDVPDGTAASGADMLKAKKAVEEYVEKAQEYMNCGVAGPLQERMASKMEKVVDRFNRELRAYKDKG